MVTHPKIKALIEGDLRAKAVDDCTQKRQRNGI